MDGFANDPYPIQGRQTMMLNHRLIKVGVDIYRSHIDQVLIMDSFATMLS